MKNSRGISLITLVITIVVIIILAGISIYNGLIKNVDEAVNTADYNEIIVVSDAVSQRTFLNRLNANAYQLIGTSGEFTIEMEQLSGDEEIEIKRTYKSADGWLLIDENNSEDLNLEKVKRKYLVNYETSEVISFEPIYYEGKKYYTASDLRDALGGGSVVVSPSRYDEDKGVNKPYVVSGMIPVKRSGDYWVVTNVDDIEWYDYAAVDSTGTAGNLWANVMLLDEIKVYSMSNEEVRRAELSELEGKRVTTEGSMYVWIPRYSRGLIDGENKIVYSKLTDDYFKGSDNTVLGAFEDDGIELTGIWISKYDAGYIEK